MTENISFVWQTGVKPIVKSNQVYLVVFTSGRHERFPTYQEVLHKELSTSTIRRVLANVVKLLENGGQGSEGNLNISKNSGPHLYEKPLNRVGIDKDSLCKKVIVQVQIFLE